MHRIHKQNSQLYLVILPDIIAWHIYLVTIPEIATWYYYLKLLPDLVNKVHW